MIMGLLLLLLLLVIVTLMMLAEMLVLMLNVMLLLLLLTVRRCLRVATAGRCNRGHRGGTHIDAVLAQLIDDVPVQARIGELCGAIVVVHVVDATGGGFALLPAAGQRTERLEHGIVRVKVARNARIVPGGDARWGMIEVDLTLRRCACFCWFWLAPE